jgi:molybdopterin converting factor subunit 1
MLTDPFGRNITYLRISLTDRCNMRYVDMNHVTAYFFATLRERAGIKSVEMEIPPETNVAGFKAILSQKYPALAGLAGHVLVAINHEYVLDGAILPDLAEIALFPPVSGG